MSDLQAFAENVWIVEGPNVRDFGVMFTTRMTVVRLSGGLLWVNSPVSVPSDTLKRITESGPVRYLVAATPRHVWRLERWHTLFPRSTAMGAANHPIYFEERTPAIHRHSRRRVLPLPQNNYSSFGAQNSKDACHSPAF